MFASTSASYAFSSQPEYTDGVMAPMDNVFGQAPSYVQEDLGDSFGQQQPVPSTSTAFDPTAYNAWQPLRESLPSVAVDRPQMRQSSYYPLQPSRQNTLEGALGLEQDGLVNRARPPSRAHELHPASSFDTSAPGPLLHHPVPSASAPSAAQNAAYMAARAHAKDQPSASAGKRPAAPSQADVLASMLDALDDGQGGSASLDMAGDGSQRGATYGAYPSQWDFIAQPDSYSSDPRGTYTPSYDSLSLAADEGDSLFGHTDRFNWRSHSEVDSEDALSVLNTANCTPDMSDNETYEIDAAGSVPLFAPIPQVTLQADRQPTRADTLRMSAERAGHGLEGAAGTASSLTGEVLHASPPPEMLTEPKEEREAISPSLKPFISSANNPTSPISRGNSLPKLEIPQSSDSTMSATSAEETAQPRTARPGGRPSAEVEKLLEQLGSQNESQASVPAFSFAPATPADAMNIYASSSFDGRPSRQRSLSDAQIPQWSGIDPRMLAGNGYIHESAVSDDDDLHPHDGSIGPRRRSAASQYASPYLGAQHLRDQQHRAASEEPTSPASGMRRALSHNFGHRRNAYSEDFGMPVNQDYMPQFFHDHAVVPSFDGSREMDFRHGFMPLPVPGMQQTELSAVPPHVRSISRASSHGSSPGSISSDAFSETGGEIIDEPVHWDSQTTVATKQAANARRKPGTEPKFVCDYCGETFTRQYNLKGHLRAHNGEKPFACDFPGCDKAFARAHDRSRHMALHSNLAKYKCNACGRAFKRLDALQRHHKSDAGKHCVTKLLQEGEPIPFPGTNRQAVVL